jgi:hypothetical protein
MDLTHEIDYADLIFQGIPVEKEQIETKFSYKFIVKKIWKGEKVDTIRIETNVDSRRCEMIFELNKPYIVFSTRNQTSYCRRNSLLNETFDDLKLDYILLDKYRLNSFTDTNKNLNTNESDYLMRQFINLSKKYDFTNKSILFTSNLRVITKKEWFQYYWSYAVPSVQLVELTEKERIETGYDAILVTYSKRYIDERFKKKIIKQIIFVMH